MSHIATIESPNQQTKTISAHMAPSPQLNLTNKGYPTRYVG